MDGESIIGLQRAWQISTRQAQLPAVEERLQLAAGLTLTRPARIVLAHLSERGALHVSELAAVSGVDVSTMSRTLRHLGDSGFISRQPGCDLRAVLVSITEAGEKGVAQMRAAGQQMLRDVLCGWSETDRNELSRLMTRFAEDFSTYLGRTSGPNYSTEVKTRA